MIWLNVLQEVICAIWRAHGVMTMETLSMWWNMWKCGMGGGNGLKNGVRVHQNIRGSVTIADGDVEDAKPLWKIWLAVIGIIQKMPRIWLTAPTAAQEWTVNDMRLGDLDELVSKIDELSKGAGFYRPIYEGFLNAIKNQPTIDAVPVVRCKDCKHFGGHGTCHYHAADENGTPIFVRGDDFCSYGERKDGGD